ncbi:MAG: hypothetical protein LKF87_14625 [Clostridium tyrobutyricum]|jgi:preprotein translocase subunit YajC|uniref:hypothetical protein n=1 Tax=Clostridium tyrobutyricum TaxID=1519 RepID=UPI002432B55A|nr:hypothetical protein [Clostridium tyrobutyricum]MCH4200643.1 hypothetical protein [Clostridium tyrobutyricum]MCH4237541.1 hypothetical protein [Clostridium tyrobutyricum]MCH4260148.1 hypothetical protein [Clostridium tyrobutyricum]MCI2011742.1 hypothetical protein [Clostridium tyrobutyricum]
MEIKPNSTVILKSGVKGKIIGELEDGIYMLKNSNGKIIYCKAEDIVSVETKKYRYPILNNLL